MDFFAVSLVDIESRRDALLLLLTPMELILHQAVAHCIPIFLGKGYSYKYNCNKFKK